MRGEKDQQAISSLIFEGKSKAKSNLKANQPILQHETANMLHDSLNLDPGISYKHYNNQVKNIYLQKMRKYMKKTDDREEERELTLVRHMTPSERANQHKTTQQIVDELISSTNLKVNDIKKKKGPKGKKIGGKTPKPKQLGGEKADRICKKDENLTKRTRKKVDKPQSKKKEFPKPHHQILPQKAKNQKPRLDLRTLSLKSLVGMLNDKKVCGASFNYRLYPNLLGNEEEFIKLYGENKITKNYFNLCMLTPFDHRMLARICAHINFKAYYVGDHPNFSMEESKPQAVETFYDNLYNLLSELQYYKKVLQFEYRYSRKSISRLRKLYQSSVMQIIQQEENVNRDNLSEEERRQDQLEIRKVKKQIEELKEKLKEEQKQQEMMATIEQQIKCNTKGRKMFKMDQPITYHEQDKTPSIIEAIPNKDTGLFRSNSDKNQIKFSIKDVNFEQIYNNNKFVNDHHYSRNHKNVMIQEQRGSDYSDGQSRQSASSYSSKSSSFSSVDSQDLERKIKRRERNHHQYQDISNSDSYLRDDNSESSKKADPDDLSLDSILNSGEQSFIDEIVSSNESKKEQFSPLSIPENKCKKQKDIQESQYQLSGMSDSP